MPIYKEARERSDGRPARDLDLLITADWGASENNRRARFYSPTEAGRTQLTFEVSKWDRLSAGVKLVVQRT